MELSRQEYPALVEHLQPNQASTVVSDRLKAISKLNTDIADWLLERRKLEENYVLGLRKLARRPQPETSASLGIFELPWRRIVSSTENLAQSHETLAREIEADVEKPLKEYASKNSDMQSMPSVHQDLITLAKELEYAQKRAAKVRGKSGGKSSAAAAAVEDAKTQWESRAPFVLEKLQAVDEHRINHLRDVLTQFQTHEADQIERNRQSTENCLNALLSLESADEIKTFAAKVSGGRSAQPENRDQAAAASLAESAPLPPPPKIQDDTASQRSSRSRQGRPSMASSEQQRSTAFGGLKRLGTVMGRRKSVVQGSGSGQVGSPEKKFRSPFSGFRKNDSSRNFQQMDETIAENGIKPVKTGESSSSRRKDTKDTLTRSPAQTESISENVPSPTPNGAAIPEDSAEAEPQDKTSAKATAPAADESKTQDVPQQPQTDAEGYSMRPDTVDEITRIQREAAAEDSGANLTIRDKPIEEDKSQAQQALNEMANSLRVHAQQSGISRGTGTLRGRRDVRNTIFIPNPSAPEPEPTRGLSPSVSAGIVSNPVSPAAKEPKSAVPTDGNQDDHPISDNASIQSSRTLHSLSGPISHPELQSPGLNVSVVEKLSVLISEGTITRSYVVGELAMAYNPEPGNKTSASEAQLVRLDNFHVLERVAANPQFVAETQSMSSPSENDRPSTSTSQEKKGVYNISLPLIIGPAPNVAFKYQVHLDSSNLSSYCPVIFTPIWNEEEFQASVIITYSLNPKFISSQPVTSVTLKNLVLNVNLDLNPTDETTKQPREVARATGAAMHPNTGATFRRKTSAVVWKLPELVVTAGDDGKFLARFSTSTSWPRKGKVEAKFDASTSDNGMRLGVSSCIPASSEADKSGDPFADGSTPPAALSTSTPKAWKELPIERKLSVARYVSS